MATNKLLLLAGDGIGPEVMAEEPAASSTGSTHQGIIKFEIEEGLVGGIGL